MKTGVFFFAFLFFSVASEAQSRPPGNIFIITTDGFRWQEVFHGADSLLLCDTSSVKDTSLMRQQYWSNDPAERRRRLLPFFWNVIAEKGTLAGNRTMGNEMNVSNLYKISYPGYSELLTGFADRRFIPNLTVRNRNTNVLEYLNHTSQYAGKVAAFSSWNVMPYIINEERSEIPVNSGYHDTDADTDPLDLLITQVQETVPHKGNTRQDMLTYARARNYIESQHPRVVFLGLGETDEYAHKGRYDQYLNKAHQVDQMIADLWYYVQTDPFYKDNTTFIITTDHGRGSRTDKWSQHGFWVKGSGQIWIAMIGAGVAADGERKDKERIYQKQVASTVSILLHEKFRAEDHPVAAPISTGILTVTNTDKTLSADQNR